MKDISYYQNEIKKAENRQTSYGFFKGDTTIEQQLYNQRSEMPTKEFVGIVTGYNQAKKMLLLEQRNYFSPGDLVEIFTPNKNTVLFKVDKIYDEDSNVVEVARHPLQKLMISFGIDVPEYSMIRRVDNE